MTKATSPFTRLLYATGVALFLAAPVTLAQFSLTWDFTDNQGGAYVVAADATVDLTVAETGTPLNYLSSAAAASNISWSPYPSATKGPTGGSTNGAAVTDGWVMKGNEAEGGALVTANSWLQSPGGVGAATAVISGTTSNPAWGDGTIGSASYLVIDLPTFLSYTGDPLVLDSIEIVGGAHGQNGFEGPWTWGVYESGGALLGSTHNTWDTMQTGFAWSYETHQPLAVTIDTDASVAQGADFDLLFFAGYDVTDTNTGPLVLDSITLNFSLGAPAFVGGYGAAGGASGTPEPAGALLGLLSLGMVSFRRKRRS